MLALRPWQRIRDDFFEKSKVKKDFVEEKRSDSLSGDGFLGWAKDYPLSKAMVDHDQERIEAGRKGEIGDEITGNLLEGARGHQLNGW